MLVMQSIMFIGLGLAGFDGLTTCGIRAEAAAEHAEPEQGKPTQATAPNPDGPRALLTVLDETLAPLIRAFNEAKDRPRLVALFSPT